MSYLSRRMREEGFWGRPKASEQPLLTVTFTYDTSRFDRAVERARTHLERVAAAFDTTNVNTAGREDR